MECFKVEFFFLEIFPTKKINKLKIDNMKHTRLYSCFLAVVMLVVASATALAQDFVYSAKNVTFLKPGEKGTIAVRLNNKETFRSLEGYIYLPDGLTFVEKKKDRYFINPVGRIKDAEIYLSAIDEHTAFFLVNSTDDIAKGDDEIFTFDVNASEELPIASDVKFGGLTIAVATDKPLANADNFEAKVCNANYELIPGAKVDGAWVEFSMKFSKELSLVQLDAFVPEGLLMDSLEVNTSFCPNHKVTLRGNHIVVSVKDIYEDRRFVGTEGAVFRFKVVPDNTISDNKYNKEGVEYQLLFKNIKATATEEVDGENVNTLYYGSDFAVDAAVDASVVTGINRINGIETIGEGAADGIYQLNGVRTDKMQRGVNIVVKDGKAIKVVKK